MKSYPKINGPFKRNINGPSKGLVIYDDWSLPEIQYLSKAEWTFTEKVDGTNIRIHWDCENKIFIFAGRTDNSEIPTGLHDELKDRFFYQIFEDNFPDTSITLYGEGYGGNIQKAGPSYSDTYQFILFDVLINGIWLERESMMDIAKIFGIRHVPLVNNGTIYDAIKVVSSGLMSSLKPLMNPYIDKMQNHSKYIDQYLSEGLVGIPSSGLLDRKGNRIMVKIKSKDFYKKEI